MADTIFRLATLIPLVRNVPTAKNRIITDFQAYMSRIAEDVLQRNSMKGNTDKSVLGFLSMCLECRVDLNTHRIRSTVKSLAEHPSGEFRLSHAEVLAQVACPTFTADL